MKLYRIQNKKTKLGIWHGGIRNDYLVKAHNKQYKMFMDMSVELYAPREYEYTVEFDDMPKEAVFYFKEEFWIKYKELFDDMKNAKIRKFKIVEVELDNIMKYTMYYQDENQCCVHII